MIAPAALVILTPIIIGAIFGVEAVVGFLAGAMSSSVQLAISMSNSGGAWDNAKKFTEKGGLNGWFMYRDGRQGLSEEDFKKQAKAGYNGDNCLMIPGPSQAPGYLPPGMMMSPPMYAMGGQMVVGAAFGAEEEMAMVSGANYGYPPQVYGPPSQGYYQYPQYPSQQQPPMNFKEWLSELSKHDPGRYKKIMQGEEGVPTTDGRMCIYAGKKSSIHAATVVGDTVGDPYKDTSGPALNIVMKLMAILSVVFADFFMSINHGNGAALSGDLKY
jgi:hypothetical protein